MKILTIETTDLSGSVAASIDSNLLQEIELNRAQRSAQSLAPAMRDLFSQVGWQPSEVQLVAVTLGPGSFTGLRVGVTTAKTFAYAVGAEILGIDTLETIAAQFTPHREGDAPAGPLETPGFPTFPSARLESRPPDITQDSLEVVLDAQRGEVVAGSFSRSEDGWFRPTEPQRLMSSDSWLAELSERAKARPGSLAVTGPILQKLQKRIPPNIIIVDERLWHPRAAQVARLAARDYAAGRRDDLWTLLPRYSRRSAAEEKLEKK